MADEGTPLPRTPDEIVTEVKRRYEDSFLGFHREVMLPVLPWEHIHPFLKEGNELTEDSYAAEMQMPSTVEAQMKEAREYCAFAWEKAIDHRGISAGRSVEKMRAHFWLMGREGEIDWERYAPYGVPILRQICEVLDWPIPSASEETAHGTLGPMLDGDPCSPDCSSCTS